MISTPAFDLSAVSTLMTNVFAYAAWFLAAFGGIAALGGGIRLGKGLLVWIMDIVLDAFK